MDKMALNHRVRFRVDFSRFCSLGPGKIELLESIERTGSLRQAARALGMSYRRAWTLLDDLNRSFTKPAATVSNGGDAKGGMTLTAVGKEIIRCYHATGRAIEAVVHSKLERIAAQAVEKGAGDAGTPRKRLARRLRGR